MTITDEIVETACIACAVSAWPEGWKYAPEHQRAILRVRMRAALEAVAPAIRAAALEEAAAYCDGHQMGTPARFDGPFPGYIATASDQYGTHAGRGYADAIRNMKGDAQ